MTTEVKRIVCLANSYMPGGRCIAGKEVLPDGRLGGWIRPVLSAEKVGIGNERMYENEMDPEPRVLDVVEIPFRAPAPKDHQRENWLIARQPRWKRTGRFEAGELRQYIDPLEPLWFESDRSLTGEIDRVPYSHAKYLMDSLRLITVTSLKLFVYSNARGQQRVRGRFTYVGKDHSLTVTDDLNYPARFLRDRYTRGADGSYLFNREILLTVSLGGQYIDGNCYKLIASVINPDGGRLS